MKADHQVQQDVTAELSWEPAVHAARIGVEVKDGVVTLSGQVDWWYQRETAKDSVRYLLGVVGVSNEIAIKPAVSAVAVKSDIEAALKRTAADDAKKIKVAVHGSDITLSGSVHNWAERESVTTSAWGTPGVRNVTDNMTLAY